MIQTFLSAFSLFLIPITIGWFVMKKPRSSHMVLLALATFGSYALWRWISPYPYSLNWDIWEHQTVIHAILSGKFSLVPSQLSDTFGFNGYTTLFHLLLAIPQGIFKPDILGFWWIAEVYMAFLTAMAAYALTRAVTRRSDTALVAGVLSVFCFESSIVFTPFFLLPQTLAATLWSFGFAWIVETRKPDIRIILVLSAVCVALHAIVGGAGVLLYILFFLLRAIRFEKISRGVRMAALFFPIFIYAILNLSTTLFHLRNINFGEAAAFTQSITQKLAEMQSWYGYLPIILLPLGVIAMALSQSKTREDNRIILFLLLTTLAVVASPAPYSMKFYIFVRYFLVVYLACGIVWLTDAVKNPWGKILSVFLLLFAQGVIFWANVVHWQLPLTYQGIASQVSASDMRLAQFLKNTNRQSCSIIVSDPATSAILEGLSGVNSPGGAYMTKENRETMTQLTSAPSADELNQKLTMIRDGIDSKPVDVYLWIVSARYLQWLDAPQEKQESLSFNVWRPQALSLSDSITIFRLETRLGITPIFANDSAVVFAIKGETL
jgi:hypothetical protein